MFLEAQIAELKVEVHRLNKIIKYSNITYHKCNMCDRIMNPKYKCNVCKKVICSKCDHISYNDGHYDCYCALNRYCGYT